MIQSAYDSKIIDDVAQHLDRFAKLVKEEFTFDAIALLLASLEKMILSNHALGNGMQDVYGVSIYFPRSNPFKETFEMYEKLDFSHDYPNWIGLIRWYHS